MFTPTFPHSHRPRKRFFITLVLLAGFLIPSNLVLAQASGPSKTNPWCFTSTEGVPIGDQAAMAVSYCYPDLGACQAGYQSKGDTETQCHDAYAAMSKFEKTVAEKGFISATGEKIVDTVTGGLVGLLGTVLEFIGSIGAKISGIFMLWMADVLDIAIDRTINSATYSNLAAVNIGWTAVRDLANMFFIFVLLYISILTVLGQAGSNAKRWVVNLVIAALLINFSLFFTKVVIDAGNALSVGIWNNLKTKQSGEIVNGVASHFSEAFRVQTNFDTTGNDATGAPIPQPDAIHRAMIYFGATIVQFIAGYIFLAGAIMMIVRTVTLLIVMMVSPFAFLGFALPKGGGFAGQWLSKLIGATFVAPAFIFMLYLDSIIIHTPDINALGGGQDAKWALAFEGNPASFAIFYQFAIMVIMLLASMTVAQKVGNGVGDSAGNLAKRGLGGGVAIGLGSAGAFGRQTIGRFGRNRIENEEWRKEQQKLVAKGGMWGRVANLKLQGAQAASKGTFDIRNAPMGGLGVTAALGVAGVKAGQGSKKSYDSHGQVGSSIIGGFRGTEAEKDLIATAKARFPDNPEAQKKWLTDRQSVDLGAYRNKDAKSEIERKIVTEKEKENINTQKDRLKNIDMTTAEGKAIGEEVAKSIEASMAKLSGKEAESLIKKGDPAVLAALGRQHLNYMNTNSADFSDEVLKDANDAVMATGGAGASYLIQQAKMGSGAFPTNLEDALKKRQESYKKEIGQFTKLNTDTAQEAEKKRLAKADFDDKHDSAVQDILGGMSIKEVARLSPELKSDPAMVRNYTEKHFNEIESYHKNIKRDAEDPGTQKMFEDIRNNAINGGKKKTSEYMNKAKNRADSVFFDSSALTSAQAELAAAKSSGLNGKIADAEKKVRNIQEGIAKAQQSSKNSSLSSGDDSDE